MEYSVDVGAYELGAFCDPEVILFRRGDCNSDGSMDYHRSDWGVWLLVRRLADADLHGCV
ncbi:MAG: hypothetical protein MK538_09690 [Planctomycetes bacterium]|nr:hypothetical protein [Planctomycetota bacterium]